MQSAWVSPWGVELNQNILAFVVDDFVEVLADNDLHVASLFGNRLRFEVGLEITADDLTGEFFQRFVGEVTGHLVLLIGWTASENVFAVFLHIVDSELGQFMTEFLGVADTKTNFDVLIGELLGHFQDAIAHVVGALGVPSVVNIVIDNNAGFGIIGEVRWCTVTDETMAESRRRCSQTWIEGTGIASHFLLDVGFDFLADAFDNGIGVFEFRLEAFWLVDNDFA